MSQVLHAAARVIQKKWKKFIRALKLVQALMIRQKLAHCEWRVLMWYRTTKRKMQAQLLRTFFKVSECKCEGQSDERVEKALSRPVRSTAAANSAAVSNFAVGFSSQDFAVQQVAYIIFTFRFRVVRVQRMMKSFLACKKARKLVLEKMWLRMEKSFKDEESAFKKRKVRECRRELSCEPVHPPTPRRCCC